MESVTLTQREMARLQVLNSLLAQRMTTEQAATLMGVSARHTRRLLAACREEGAAALAHGNRGRRPANITPDSVIAEVVHLARTRYRGNNHTHLGELLREGGHRYRPDHTQAYPGRCRTRQSPPPPSTRAQDTSAAYAAGGHACPA